MAHDSFARSDIVAQTVEALARGNLDLLPPVWRSEASRKLLRAVDWMAPTEETILLTGGSGTGKSFVAEVVHRRSQRAPASFTVIPIAGLSQTLVHSELFGHEAHAFTDAGKRRRLGLIEESAGGTVFLDEIGDIQPPMQLMLLRFLQDKRFRRLGGNKELHSDVRVLAATNRDLSERVERGEFREDTYFRISTFTINMPDLSERREDIPALASTFLSRLASQAGGSYGARRLSRSALKALVDHPWPGNIRELEKAIIWAFYHAGSHEVIETGDLPLPGYGLPPAESAARKVDGSLSASRFESCYLEAILRLSNWNITRAAEILDLKPDTVRQRAKRAGFKRPSPK